MKHHCVFLLVCITSDRRPRLAARDSRLFCISSISRDVSGSFVGFYLCLPCLPVRPLVAGPGLIQHTGQLASETGRYGYLFGLCRLTKSSNMAPPCFATNPHI